MSILLRSTQPSDMPVASLDTVLAFTHQTDHYSFCRRPQCFMHLNPKHGAYLLEQTWSIAVLQSMKPMSNDEMSEAKNFLQTFAGVLYNKCNTQSVSCSAQDPRLLPLFAREGSLSVHQFLVRQLETAIQASEEITKSTEYKVMLHFDKIQLPLPELDRKLHTRSRRCGTYTQNQ